MNISDIRQVFIRMMALSLLVTGGGTAAATTVAELEEAIKRGDTLEQIVAMFEEGPEVNYKVTLLPGKEPAPLICALADDAVYGYSDEHKGLDLPYNQAEAMAALLDNGAPRTPAMPWDAPRCPILSNTTSSSLRTAGSTILHNGPKTATSLSLIAGLMVSTACVFPTHTRKSTRIPPP